MMLYIFEKPNALLKLEGLAIFFLALAIYWHQSYDWTLFWSTILLPDLALLGYLVTPGTGAICYNITHAKLLPCILALVSIASGNTWLLSLALIWFVHIGFDRMLGYGLKYPEGFRATHLGELGQPGNHSFTRHLPCGK